MRAPELLECSPGYIARPLGTQRGQLGMAGSSGYFRKEATTILQHSIRKPLKVDLGEYSSGTRERKEKEHSFLTKLNIDVTMC